MAQAIGHLTCEPGDALRKEQHEQQDHATERGPPVFCIARDRIMQPGKRDRANDGARQRLNTAEQHHDQPVDRFAHVQCFGRNAPLGIGIETASESGKCTGNHKSRPLDTPHINADRIGAHGRIAARAQCQPERGKQHAAQRND